MSSADGSGALDHDDGVEALADPADGMESDGGGGHEAELLVDEDVEGALTAAIVDGDVLADGSVSGAPGEKPWASAKAVSQWPGCPDRHTAQESQGGPTLATTRSLTATVVTRLPAVTVPGQSWSNTAARTSPPDGEPCVFEAETPIDSPFCHTERRRPWRRA